MKTILQLSVFQQAQKIYSLDLAALIAGTKYRGEFEARLKQVLQLVAGWPEYVLFIDEIHMLMGAGGAESALDASNILKPALSRGEPRCIGATTPTEYQQYIEKDTAFARRFQAITVVEPDTATVRQILAGLRSLYTEHHGVQVSDEMLCYVTESARKYVHERYFPDKALDLLDEALAKASLSALNAAESCLTKEHVVAVLHQWTGLPPDIFTAGYAQRLADLELFLKDSVFGREPSMTHLLNVLKQRYASHKDGCNAILLLGPPACGKTLLVDLMAQKLFDNCNVTELELAAYGEKHSLNGLMGANPGYAGYGEKPFLSRVLQDCNNGMLVIRNFRQAHVSEQELFSGLCQNGKVTDGAGGEIRAGNLFYVFIEETGATDLTLLTTLSKKIKAQIIELQPLEHSNFEIEMLC